MSAIAACAVRWGLASLAGWTGLLALAAAHRLDARVGVAAVGVSGSVTWLVLALAAGWLR